MPEFDPFALAVITLTLAGIALRRSIRRWAERRRAVVHAGAGEEYADELHELVLAKGYLSEEEREIGLDLERLTAVCDEYRLAAFAAVDRGVALLLDGVDLDDEWAALQLVGATP